MELTVTPKAVRRFERLAARQGTEWFRVDGAQDCECGKVGFRVEMADARGAEDDVVRVAADGAIGLLVSPASRPYVDGSTIDFSDDLMHTGFVVENPRVQTWCGRAPQ